MPGSGVPEARDGLLQARGAQGYEACDELGRVEGALPVELGDHHLDEALADLEEGDLAEAQVEADPQEGLEEGAQLPVHVEETLRPLGETLEQLAAEELAVAHQLAVEEGGRLCR